MNELEIFKNEEFGEIRTIQINNEPYFCMVDICRALELGNVSQALIRLNKDGVISNEVIDSLGRKQKANFVNESNMYKLIFQSRKNLQKNLVIGSQMKFYQQYAKLVDM